MKSRNDKSKKLEQYEEVVQEATYAILTEHGKVSVSAMDDIRKEVRESGGNVMVMKNTLAHIVFERNGHEEVCEYLEGPSMLFYGADEVAPVAKLIKKKSKEFPGIKVKAILFDGNVYHAEKFSTFTDMPTKHEARSMLVGIMKAPISNFVHVIGPAGRLVTVLGQYAEKKAG